jgi:hypothetical protein
VSNAVSKDGYVHVTLRQYPPAPGQPDNTARVELSVIDTGKVCLCGMLLLVC